MSKDSMTAKELSRQKFDGITLVNPYGLLLGPIELSAVGFIWGPNFSGKSTLALGMADALAKFDRIEYVPAEEHFGITLTKKINRLKTYNGNLHFRRYKGLESLKKHLKDVKAKVVFIDSVSVLNENDSEVVQFAQWCRDEKIGMWMVAHANKDGSYKGNSKFGHEADIRIEVLPDDSMAYTRKNRYLGELRSIPVPMTHKDIERKSGKKSKSKKKKSSKKTKRSGASNASKDDFDSQMDEVEQMMSKSA